MIRRTPEIPNQPESAPSSRMPVHRQTGRDLQQVITPQSAIDHTTTPEHLRLPENIAEKVWTIMKRKVESYGITVDEKFGDGVANLDGNSITVDPRLDRSTKLFFLLHFFGHTVQFLAPALAESTKRFYARKKFSRAYQVKEFIRYEAEVAALGLSLFQQENIDEKVGHDVSGWLRRLGSMDSAYAQTNFHDGKNVPFKQFEEADYPIFREITPLSVPDFRPRKIEPYAAI